MNSIERSTELTIFGKSLRVKNYVCRINGCPYREKKKPVKLTLSITPSSYCGGQCPFCSAKQRDIKQFLDIKKLETVLRELKNMDAVRGISITGGEPFTDVSLLNEIIELIFDIFGIEMEIGINTNGSGLRRVHEIKRLAFVDNIHISRHHYDDQKNRKYFKTDVPDAGEIREIVDGVYDPKLFVFNCLLLSDGIGSKEDMVKMLEFAGDVHVPKVGFITPMQINDYTKNNAVSYTTLFDRDNERFLYTMDFRDFDFCHCQDGVYVTETGRLVEFYGRETCFGNRGYVRTLVYGADNVLCAGYGNDAQIIYTP